MKRTYQSVPTRNLRTYINCVAHYLFKNLMNDKSNWIFLSDFDHACFDDGDIRQDNLCGFVFKHPIIINGISYLVTLSSYYQDETTLKQNIENLKEAFHSNMENPNWDEHTSVLNQEWVFGTKKIPYVIGGSV